LPKQLPEYGLTCNYCFIVTRM